MYTLFCKDIMYFSCHVCTFTSSLYSFSVLNCVEIPNPKNGHVHVESTRYHGIARYECNTGYELSGQDVRKCQGNGQWSGIPPQCIGKLFCPLKILQLITHFARIYVLKLLALMCKHNLHG